jgi:uncharacterized membrane protein YeaQ/YmgE (transglycosylase-associated protein family)
MLTTEAAGLVLKIAKGLVKLTRQVDLVLAEKEAVTTPLSLPAPELNLAPFPEDMEKALGALLAEPYPEGQDPIAEDREAIQDILRPGADPSSAQMFPLVRKYLPEMAIRRSVDLNSEFMRALREARPEWAADPEIRVAAFYVHAGTDDRKQGYSWRLALTVVDAVAEFGAENTALFVRDSNLQGIVGAVLKRFGEADLQTTESPDALLRAVLRATLNGVVDAKEHLDIDNDWMEGLVNALAASRSKASDPDNFLVGLVQGKGYPLLVGSVMAKASGQLGAGDADAFERTAASFLESVAGIVEAQPTFDDFFKDYWGDLLRAGLHSVETHGPALLADEEPLLGKIVTAVAGDLARRPENKFLTRETLVGLVDAVVGTVAAHPDRIDELLSDDWLATLIHSVAGTMSHEGILKAFTREGLEILARDVLHTFGEQPELIVQDPGLAQHVLGGVLLSVSEVGVFQGESLANAAVEGALETVSDYPELLRFDYGDMVADLAGKIATLVKDRKMTNLQGQDIAMAAMASLAENPKLMMDLEKKLAGVTIDAVVEVAGEDVGGMISGGWMADTVAGVLHALTVAGKAALDNRSMDVFEGELKELLRAGMVRAGAELGVRMGLPSLPDVVERLVMAWAQGKIEVMDSEDEGFIELFAALAEDAEGAVH